MLDRWCADFFDVASTWWSTPDIGPVDDDRIRLLRSVAPAPRKVLELGCGTGTTAVAASAAGYSVTGIDVSHVRIAKAGCRTAELAGAVDGSAELPPVFLQADFYTAELGETYDVVTYWNGFGVGTDHDQRFLLHRVASEWLDPGGVLIMDVYAPWRWASINGRHYEYRDLVCENRFDPVASRFEEQWWRRDEPEAVITQYGRCYSPADFLALIAGLGLEVSEFRVGEKVFGPDAADPEITSALLECWEYTAVLRHTTILPGGTERA